MQLASESDGHTPSDVAAEHDQPVHVEGLTALDVRILAFERGTWPQAGAKEQAIRAEFALATARYYQLLNAALDRPEALAFDPMLVRRLQRLRDSRTQARSARQFRPAR